MDFESEKEFKQFLEIASIIKYYQYKEVPVPEDVVKTIEANKDSSTVFYVLNDMLKDNGRS